MSIQYNIIPFQFAHKVNFILIGVPARKNKVFAFKNKNFIDKLLYVVPTVLDTKSKIFALDIDAIMMSDSDLVICNCRFHVKKSIEIEYKMQELFFKRMLLTNS